MLYSEKLSLCMIIRDEEKYLAKCLEAIKDYVDEIIIVDTGSTDNSKDIAKRYTDRIYDFKWCNDFSNARNFSIAKATSDWILILDADEILLSFDKKEVYNFIEKYKKQKVVGRIKIINFFEEDGEIKKNITYISRFFNKNLFCYEGSIHEQIVTKDRKQHQVKSLEISIEHFGYLDENMRNKNKFERNIYLLKSEINKNPKDPYYHYQIGKTYYKVKQYKKASQCFRYAINICDNFRYEYAEDLIISYGYALLKCEKYSEALELINYQQYYSQSPDYNFIIGLIYMNNGRFQEAINEFQKCIGQTEGKVEGINSYQPNYNIGVIYEMLGYEERAIQFYESCGKYLPAAERLRILKTKKQTEHKYILKEQIKALINENKLNMANEMLDKYKNIVPQDIDIYSIQSVIFIMEGKLDKAEQTLIKGLSINGSKFELLYNLAYIYQCTDRKENAVQYYKKALENAYTQEDKKEVFEILNNL